MRSATAIVLVLVTAVLIIWDVIAYTQGGVDATISKVILDLSYDWPIVAFAAGLLCGHFFWPVQKPTKS